MSGIVRPRGLHMSLSAFASFIAGTRLRSAAFTSILSGISIHRFAAWLVGPLAIVAAFFWVANQIGGNVFAVKTKKTDCIPNERFVNDPDGRRFLELRWLMDPPGWRVRLRAPAEYVIWADVGCESATMPGYPDPNYRDVYVHGFRIGVNLPDFAVLHPSDRHIWNRGLDTTKMVVRLSSQAKVQGGEAEKVQVIQKDFYDTQRIFLDPESVSLKSSHLTVGPKPDKFNLKRVGAIGDMSRYKTELGGVRPSISTMSTENRSISGSSVRRKKSRITRKIRDGIVAPNARCFSAMPAWTL
ncbi:hypothetical protein [Methylocystis sp. SB2]|uniref:hypothetical protein n=1 Tax=Methylocystis sp. (strain SB2) TaxID=743836 RepID=UPI001EFBD3A1|nr:hypothetical protein [Methylocystis sp. SB2]ULO25001.1 hypothetical protein LNB28_06300 [Methylocystis sp. SB2]